MLSNLEENMKLGIIGSGMIVKDFLSFAHKLPEIKLEAITARNIENLKELQSKYNINNIYWYWSLSRK